MSLGGRYGRFWATLLAFIVWGTAVWLTLSRFQGYNAHSFDLGTMSQAIWNAGQGQPLIYTNAGVPISRLAIHVELIYFLLAPFYAILPLPMTLLVVQATLFVLGAIPVYRLASRRFLSQTAVFLLVAVYLFYPVAQTAVLFELHGDTLAMPLLLFALDALDRRAPRAYGFWLFLSLLCKFYVAIPVTVVGFVLWLKGDRRWGTATFLAGFVWIALVFGLIRPAFANAEIADPKVSFGGYLQFYFGKFRQIGATSLARLTNGMIVLLPALFLGRRAPRWLLVAASIILPVMISSGPGPSYAYKYHHYALAVPFLMMAIIDGAAQLFSTFSSSPRISAPPRNSASHSRPTAVAMTLFIVLVFNIVTVDGPLSPFFYNPLPGSAQGLSSSGYLIMPRDAFKDDWLARLVPDDTAVAANRQMALRLVNRETLYLNTPLYKSLDAVLPELDLVVADALYDFVLGNETYISEGVTADLAAIQLLLQQPDWQLQEAQDGLLLFGKDGSGLAQEIEMLPLAGERPYLAQFDDAIGLLDAVVEPMGGNRYRIMCEWTALRPLTDQSPLIAVSQPEGLEHARIVHLPTMALLPTTQWPTGQIVRETFEITLPDDARSGSYPLVVSWYDTNSLYAAETDARSRVGEPFQIGRLQVP